MKEFKINFWYIRKTLIETKRIKFFLSMCNYFFQKENQLAINLP